MTPPLKKQELSGNIKIILLFSYYYKYIIVIFILLEVHTFEGVHDKGFPILKKDGATVSHICSTEWGFHCDGNYVCTQILDAHIIS